LLPSTPAPIESSNELAYDSNSLSTAPDVNAKEALHDYSLPSSHYRSSSSKPKNEDSTNFLQRGTFSPVSYSSRVLLTPVNSKSGLLPSHFMLKLSFESEVDVSSSSSSLTEGSHSSNHQQNASPPSNASSSCDRVAGSTSRSSNNNDNNNSSSIRRRRRKLSLIAWLARVKRVSVWYHFEKRNSQIAQSIHEEIVPLGLFQQ
jgi:hypothetical protein